MKEIKTGNFESSNGIDNISYNMFTPDGNATCIVIIAHGISEYSICYRGLAEYLCSRGMIVYTYDHAGHGKSIGEKGVLGSFAPKDGDKVLVDDMDGMVKTVRKSYRSLPLIIMGNSLGSMVARTYAAVHPESFDGMVFCSTCGTQVTPKKALKGALKSLKKNGTYGFDKNLMKFTFEGARDANPISTNPGFFTLYAGDGLCGCELTVGGYCDMFRLISFINSNEWLEEIPKSKSYLLISGSEDCIGGFGEGIRNLYEKLTDCEVSDVTMKIFKGEKHDLIQCLANAEIFDYIEKWISRVAADVIEEKQAGFYSFNR